MDSKYISDWLSKGHHPPWYLSYYVRAILAMQNNCNFVFQHCFWEANFVADGLANLVIDSGSDADFSLVRDLPQAIRGNFILDAQGTSHLRIS